MCYILQIPQQFDVNVKKCQKLLLFIAQVLVAAVTENKCNVEQCISNHRHIQKHRVETKLDFDINSLQYCISDKCSVLHVHCNKF